MWIPIFLDHWVYHVNPCQPVCFNSGGSDHSYIREINSQFFPTVSVSFVPSCLCFSRPPTLVSSRTRISLSSIHFIHVKSLHSFPSCSFLVILMKILTELQVHLSSLVFFSGGFNSSFSVLIIFFSLLQMPSHTGAPHIHSLLAIHLFRSTQDISKIRASTLLSFKIFRGCHLIRAI